MGEGQAQFVLAHSHPATLVRLDPPRSPPCWWGRRPRAGRRAGIAAAIDRSGGDSSGHPFITYSEDSSFGRVLAHHLTTSPTMTGLKPVFTSHHAGVLKVMALGGQGVAWLPRSLILAELDRRDLVPVGDQARRTIALEIRLFRPTAQLCGVAESFWIAATADFDWRLGSARRLRIDPPGVIPRSGVIPR